MKHTTCTMKHKTNNKIQESNCYMLHATCYMNTGFTFVETIVAIAVLIVSVVAPLSLAAQGLRAARIARDQIVANYLAQEGVEFLRFKRDSGAITGTGDWLSVFPEGCFSPSSCTVDIPQNTITKCEGVNETVCPALQFDDATGKYGYENGWVDTKFTRTVSLSYGEDRDREISATITVSWNDVLVNRSFVLHEELFNWQ
ncbi:MAG: hypothetical protein NUW02_02825 [Candidatus Campbellbacteria bacterium]|nr:hypothetical protein [Candidatus Campbellbacteria bacterium]